MANVTALAVARQVRLEGRMEGATLYFSDQTHSSVQRGLRLLGFLPEQLRLLPADADFRLDPAALRRAIEADRAAGLRPFCVVANAGTTNTGAVDPLPELADLCEAEGLWLHADGAYGAAAALCEPGRDLLRGLDRVDSLSLDPHKWLFQPFETGCVLVRHARWLPQTFQTRPEYLRDTAVTGGEVNFAEMGVQLTRSFRALKLWMSLKVFGRAAFEEAVRHGFEMAELAEAELRGTPGWEVVTPAHLGIVTFRRAPAGMPEEEVDALNAGLVEALFRDGSAMLSSTRLRGRTVLRLCPINPRTTAEDVRETLRALERLS
jgi:glutamate/tyrosine decarboxylase-like PLP-dependent enzyme